MLAGAQHGGILSAISLFQSKPKKTARNKVSFHWLISYLEIPVYRLVKTTCVPLQASNYIGFQRFRTSATRAFNDEYIANHSSVRKRGLIYIPYIYCPSFTYIVSGLGCLRNNPFDFTAGYWPDKSGLTDSKQTYHLIIEDDIPFVNSFGTE